MMSKIEIKRVAGAEHLRQSINRGLAAAKGREPEHAPGSPEAIAKGCTCDPAKNTAGKGTPRPGGGVRFYASLKCPLHSPAAIGAEDDV
jgi:hypothetical protein